MMRSNESTSSVFFHSQEEDPARSATDGPVSQRDTHAGALYDGYQDTMSESSPLPTEDDFTGNAWHCLIERCLLHSNSTAVSQPFLICNDIPLKCDIESQ